MTYLTLGLPSVLHCTALPLDTEEKPKSSIQWVPSDSLPIEVNEYLTRINITDFPKEQGHQWCIVLFSTPYNYFSCRDIKHLMS